MAASRSLHFSSLAFLLLFLLCFHTAFVHAQAPAPSPTSDGSAIDLGIAYMLMFVALAVTYVMHPVEGFPFNFF